MGGMGNQMSQYAAARALSHRLGTQLRFDTAYMGHADQGTVRDFELHHFRCAGRQLNTIEALRFGSQFQASLPTRALARVVRSLRPHSFYEEQALAFDPNFSMLHDDTVIVGRFQSYRYGENILDLLREELRLVRPTSAACRSLCEQARRQHSVGIHVRRTDYVDNDSYRSVIQSLPLDYYVRARKRIYEAFGSDVQLYIVSDDIAWCREQALFQDAYAFVDLSGSDYPHLEEFEVLRNCRHLVISNSTYAWWAAWLRYQNEGIVIAPENWSHVREFAGRDRIPPHWMQL